ncbi:BRO-N domain-containing protein [Roseospira visakhapatnamensis]|uniref:Prophage antirepressor-like protein n=1 Tax=Roseospira visakhapatnamensis TaxID=390880 RepID=A0A7W6RG84_9PROT|nr:Bro-N domain-containing protein [Roseospira visakhapatnamensis]MBB4268015.1 prophage antirepressor-like protein [Roseospira visakhapatnamensis]
MTAVIPFTFEDSPFRALNLDGDPWFVLADVCAVLEIGNPRDAASRLDEDEKDGVGIADAIGREQQTTIVNESGLYVLIMTSRKPAARRFRKWVTAEVLPAIRKTGRYEAAPAAPGRQETVGPGAMITIPVAEYVALSQQLIRLQREDIAYKTHKRRDDFLEKANSLVAMLFQETTLTDEQIAQALVDYAGGYMPEWVAWKRRLWTEAPVS